MKRSTLASLISLAGASFVLLGGGPALAATSSFIVDLNKAFDDSYSGVKGTMNFVFGDAGDSNANTYTLDLTLKNTSSAPIDSSSLTGFGFDTPTGVTSFSYNRNGTKFYQATKSPFTIGPATSPFTFCAFTDNNTDNGTDCGSGSAKDGLANGESATVKYTFNFAGASPGVSDVSTAFFNLFNSVVISPPNGDLADKTSVVLAARFQAINSKTLGINDGSDMITGKPRDKPDDGPGDAVPGPLPVLGAAAAFVQSRRLRRRLASARSAQSKLG
ncbi:hypothetical protein [Synechococcus sp. BO 8801]|uniref:hypothetical protein n=1 Tax=Synechococcus sp. BO 8801 TaxID=169670 RepID=UPI00117FA6A4|nr:hypothetical protein [Synechococcus sp. BO 8801]